MNSSYLDGFVYSMCFFIMFSFEIYMIVIVDPCCINLRTKISVKLTTAQSDFSSSCYVRKRFLSISYYNKSKYYQKKKSSRENDIVVRNSLFNLFEIL